MKSQNEMTDCFLSMRYERVTPGVDLGKVTCVCEGGHVALVALLVTVMQKEKKVRKAFFDAVGFYKKTYK